VQENEKLKTVSEQKRFTVYDVWKRFVVTKQWGDLYATWQLLQSCDIKPGQNVLDIGCGTGYMACARYRLYVCRKA